MRKQLHKNTGATYHDFATADDAQPRGRYGAVDQNRVVVGSTAQADYPPAASHQYDPTGIEPPLGFAIDGAPEPCGTAQEIEQALREANEGAGFPPLASDLESASPGDDVQHSRAVSPPALSKSRRRRPFSKRKNG